MNATRIIGYILIASALVLMMSAVILWARAPEEQSPAERISISICNNTTCQSPGDGIDRPVFGQNNTHWYYYDIPTPMPAQTPTTIISP